MSPIEQRVRRLEIQNRFLIAGIVLPILGALLVAATAKDAVPDVVKAKAFHVVGKDGAVLVKIEDSCGRDVASARSRPSTARGRRS